MAFQCGKCPLKLSCVPDTMIHLILVHSIINSSDLNIKCCYVTCKLNFNRLEHLREHMLSHDSQFKIPDYQSEDKLGGNPSLQTFHRAKSPRQIKLSLDAVSCYGLELDGSSIPKSTIQWVIQKTKRLFCNELQDISNFIDESDDKVKMKNYVQSKKILFSGIDSDYKIEKLYKNFSDYVKPLPVYLSTREKQVFDPKFQIYKTISKTCNFAYIPILSTLGFILSTPGIEKVIRFGEKKSNIKTYKSIFDGSIYQNSPLMQQCKKPLEIGLYYDETEVVNPLGTKVKKHKIGGIYFTLLNMPPALNSRLNHIHLVALFRVSDVTDQNKTLNDVLAPILRDLKILEIEGIQVNNVIYKGTVGGFSADNLGANDAFGMVKSFRAKHYCKVCEMDSATAKYSTVEDKNLLRDPAKYDKVIAEGVAPGEVHNLGIKFYCLLNDLNYFHIAENYTADPMHDFLEGDLDMAIKLFLKHVVNSNVMTVDEINCRILQFNYGKIEMKNKPSPVDLKKAGCLIGERAAQSWCLGRFLPLILSDIVVLDICKKEWEMVTTCLEAMDIIFAPAIDDASLDLLQKLIDKYLTIKIEVLGSHCIPKDHFATHYPTIIRLLGPLYYLWCMRYEAKHQFFKSLALKYGNFINIVKTLAKQHQHYMYNQWRLQENILKIPLEYRKRQTEKLSSLLSRYNLHCDDAEDTGVELCSGLKYGNKYQEGFFVVDGVDLEKPIFYRILQTFVENGLPYCIAKKFKTNNFNHILHAFPIEEINSPEEFKKINLSQLDHVNAYEQHQPHDSTDYYISLRHKC